MGVINVTQIERNGKPIASEKMLLDVGVISEPLLENSNNNAVILVQESIVSSRAAEKPNSVQYIANETLAAILGSTTELFVATVQSRNGKAPVVPTLGFVLEKVVGGIRAEGSGSKFFYHEGGDVLPVEYIVSETPDAIQASL